MRIALVAAEFEENLAIRYLWSALENVGHDIVFYGFNAGMETEKVARLLASSGAQIAGFSMVFTWRAGEFARVAERARELGYAGHIVAGGHFAAFNAESLLSDCPAIDSVAIGEGEALLVDLAKAPGHPARVDGLVWRKADGSIVYNQRRLPGNDLDALTVPKRRVPFDSFLGIPVVNMLSSRGCTHSCSFCSIAAWHRLCGGPVHRMRCVDGIASEMAALYGQGVRIFNFHDDNFLPRGSGAVLDRVDSLVTALQNRGVGDIAFAIKARPDEVHRELFERLKAAGLFRVFLGIEAGTDAALKALGRCQKLAHNIEALTIVNELDLHACFNLMLFNPDTTIDDLRANIRFLKEQPRNPMNFCRTEVYSGTPLEQRLRGQGRLLGDYWGYSYAIADKQAQHAYEMISGLFEKRCFGLCALHHMTMAVDYEHQLLKRFFPVDAGLQRRVKAFIVRVNHNTCSYLEELTAEAADGRTPSNSKKYLLSLQDRFDKDSAKLEETANALIREIRRTAEGKNQPALFWPRQAVAAAGITIAAMAACNTHGEKPSQREPVAIGQDAVDTLLKKEIRAKVFDRVQSLFGSRPRPVEIELHIRRNEITAGFLSADTGKIDITDRLRGEKIWALFIPPTDHAEYVRRCVFSKSEIAAYLEKKKREAEIRQTQICEMAAPPLNERKKYPYSTDPDLKNELVDKVLPAAIRVAGPRREFDLQVVLFAGKIIECNIAEKDSVILPVNDAFGVAVTSVSSPSIEEYPMRYVYQFSRREIDEVKKGLLPARTRPENPKAVLK
jgi:anaerobic magnesium-protoporphyrin IX monomethyl ester cyclase